MKFSEKLDKFMLKAKMTNYRLAKLLNVHQTTIANWRTGKTEPKAQIITKIADALKISTDELLKLKETDK